VIAVRILELVSDNVDCVFTHLWENSMALCDRGLNFFVHPTYMDCDGRSLSQMLPTIVTRTDDTANKSRDKS
jgi:phage major head subunit gpT-like protein